MAYATQTEFEDPDSNSVFNGFAFEVGFGFFGFGFGPGADGCPSLPCT